MRALFVLIALAFLVPGVRAHEPKVSAKVQKKFGEQTVGLLAGATKVEVFRIDSQKPAEKEKAVAGFRVTATGKDQDAKFATKLADVVFDEKSYEWDSAKGCIFRPGVAFRVWKGEESVAVVVCFACDQVQIVPLDKDGKAGKPVWGESDPSRAALLKLAKAALPDDKEIQDLTEKRCGP